MHLICYFNVDVKIYLSYRSKSRNIDPRLDYRDERRRESRPDERLRFDESRRSESRHRPDDRNKMEEFRRQEERERDRARERERELNRGRDSRDPRRFVKKNCNMSVAMISVY